MSRVFLGKLLSPSQAAAAQWPKRIRSDKLNLIPKCEKKKEKRAGLPKPFSLHLSLSLSFSLFCEFVWYSSFFFQSVLTQLVGEANEEVNTLRSDAQRYVEILTVELSVRFLHLILAYYYYYFRIFYFRIYTLFSRPYIGCCCCCWSDWLHFAFTHICSAFFIIFFCALCTFLKHLVGGPNTTLIRNYVFVFVFFTFFLSIFPFSFFVFPKESRAKQLWFFRDAKIFHSVAAS